MPEPTTEEHSHHHHHHRSRTQSSQTQASTYRSTGTGDYSVRSFGKRGDSTTKVLPEGTLPVAVMSVLLTALLFAPVTLVMFFRNKTLSETNSLLRDQLGRLMMQMEEGAADGNVDASLAQVPIKTRYVEDEDADRPQRQTIRTRYVEEEAAPATDSSPIAAAAPAAKRLDAPVVSDEAIASAVGMTMDEIKALRRDMRLLPNGIRLVEDGRGGETLERDIFAQNLQNGFDLLSIGQKRDAEAIFEMVSGAKPCWPYGHFYAAIASSDRSEMAKASRLFSTARALGAMTTEGELYSALASLFMKATATASSTLGRVALAPRRAEGLQIGPVYVPASTPPDILAKLRAIRGVGEIRTIEW